MGKIKLDIIWSLRLRNRVALFLKKHSSKKTLVIVNSYDKVEGIAAAIRKPLTYAHADLTILCFKSRVPEPLRELGRKVTLSEDYLSKDDHLKIDNHVFGDVTKKWAQWLLKEGSDIFAYRGVELARIAEYDLHLFLLIKVKALSVLDMAIKKERYEAVIIIDSNEELSGLERFLRRQYLIPADIIQLRAKRSFPNIVKCIAVSAVSVLIECLFGLVIQKSERSKFIDAKLFFQLGIKNKDDFILAPFSRGGLLRLNLLAKKCQFVGFVLDDSSCFNLGKDLYNIKRFDIKKLADIFIFENIHYWPLIEDKIKRLLSRDFIRYRKNVDIFIDAQTRYRIRSVILRNDVRELEKTILLTAKALGVSTIVIQHGILAEYNGHSAILADRLAAWGEYSITWYKKFGNDQQKLIVLGNPAFDRIPYYLNREKNETLLKRFNPSGKQYIISLFPVGIDMFRFSSFITDDETENLIRDVGSAVKSLGNASLVVKLHPNEKADRFDKIIKKEGWDFASITESVDLYELINISDVVITINSTVGLEAIIMGKRLISVTPSKRKDLVPYVEYGVALGAQKKEEIENAIKNLLYNNDAKKKIDAARESFVRDFVYQIDGKSRDRVIKLIGE